MQTAQLRDERKHTPHFHTTAPMVHCIHARDCNKPHRNSMTYQAAYQTINMYETAIL